MLKIRLQRAGKKNQPYFKVVLTESKNAPKSGRFLETVGSYDARGGKIQLKEDRIKYWLSQGVRLSDTVHNMLIDAKIIKGRKINVSPSVKKGKEEEKKEETKEKEKIEKKIEEKAEL
ncbi:MAG: 30S ribosomal protein S16 [Patescibacteria group bacterium]